MLPTGPRLRRLRLRRPHLFPQLRVLVNNAGVALQGQFDELDLTQIEWLMAITSGEQCMARTISTPFAAPDTGAHR